LVVVAGALVVAWVLPLNVTVFIDVVVEVCICVSLVAVVSVDDLVGQLIDVLVIVVLVKFDEVETAALFNFM
jgi:hypothetical protein